MIKFSRVIYYNHNADGRVVLTESQLVYLRNFMMMMMMMMMMITIR